MPQDPGYSIDCAPPRVSTRAADFMDSTHTDLPPGIGPGIATVHSHAPPCGAPADDEGEYAPRAPIEVRARALLALGGAPVRLGSPLALLEAIGSHRLPRLDAALNIAEGYGSRNREAWAPALLEMAGIPALGSDALSLSPTHDKAWANRSASAAGIPTPAHCLLASALEARSAPLPGAFPLFVKPRWEGTAKGIRRTSRVEDRDALEREVTRVVNDYAQPALVEVFVPGAEYTVAVVGHAPPRALPVLQRALESESGIGLHALEGDGRRPFSHEFEHQLPGRLTPSLEAELQALALRAFQHFECRDYARADFRLDARGNPIFLEMNPLPTFAPDGSFAILAELAGRPYVAWLADLLGEALDRLGIDGLAIDRPGGARLADRRGVGGRAGGGQSS